MKNMPWWAILLIGFYFGFCTFGFINSIHKMRSWKKP